MDEERLDAEMRFTILIKVIEDFISLYPASVLVTQIPLIKEAHSSYRKNQTKASLVALRESTKYIRRMMFEEKAKLKDLNDTKKKFLAEILVMTEILLGVDIMEIVIDPSRCRLCQNEATFTCSRCRSTKYCSAICQKASYKGHKEYCLSHPYKEK